LYPRRDRAFDHGRAFNFYTANLERKFGPDWREHWREETAQRLEAWGFNTIGNWSEPRIRRARHLSRYRRRRRSCRA
jgi:hypothetical protein